MQNFIMEYRRIVRRLFNLKFLNDNKECDPTKLCEPHYTLDVVKSNHFIKLSIIILKLGFFLLQNC